MGVLLLLGFQQAFAQAPLDAFERNNPVTVHGVVVGIGRWTGVRDPERFLVFQSTDANGHHERWATSVAATVPFDRDEPVVVGGAPGACC